MCQLNLIHLNDEHLNMIYLWGQAFANTLTDHKDGFGYFTEVSGINKFMIPPSLCTNAGEVIANNFRGNSPVISHVRKASITTKIPRKENIVVDNVHPFENDHFIFAHNGTLEFVDDKKMDEEKYKGLIDSRIFLKRFTEMYLSKNKSFVTSLKSTVEEFDGKFAFLIYEKSTRKYYVVRGDTALLHYYKIIINDKPVGFVVNTERDSLVKGLLYFTNYLQLNRIGSIDFDEKNIEILDRESIFLLDRRGCGKLRKIDDIKETSKSYTTYTTSRENNKDSWWERNKEGKDLDVVQKKLFDFCNNWNVSLYYLNEITLSVIGLSILECEMEDLKMITDIVIPVIEKKAKSGPKHLKKSWDKMINGSYKLDVMIHKDSGIVFPYMLETNVKVIRDYGKKLHLLRSAH